MKTPERYVDDLHRDLVGWFGRASNRRLRLFTCACARILWDLLPDAAHRAAVEVAERYADGLATSAEIREARWALASANEGAFWKESVAGNPSAVDRYASLIVSYCLDVSMQSNLVAERVSLEYRLTGRETPSDMSGLRTILRDLSSPLQLPPGTPGWRNAAVVTLAKALYHEQDFLAFPILADALEDAGCTNAAILSHLRSAGPHVRGCWALDLILAKS